MGLPGGKCVTFRLLPTEAAGEWADSDGGLCGAFLASAGRFDDGSFTHDQRKTRGITAMAWMRAVSGMRWAMVLGLLAAGLAGSAAVAQRPALVKNTDEPGRTPYEAEVRFSKGGCFDGACTNFAFRETVAFVDVNVPVPVGKRLVVRHVSGQLFGSAACGNCTVGLQSARAVDATSLKWAFWGPFYGGEVTTEIVSNAFSVDMFVTVGPGELPHLRVLVPGLSADAPSSVVISGYLIDAD